MTLVTGTFFRNPLMMAVVLKILEQIKQGGIELYENLERRTASLAARLNAYFEADDVPIRMMQVQSMLRFVPHSRRQAHEPVLLSPARARRLRQRDAELLHLHSSHG